MKARLSYTPSTNFDNSIPTLSITGSKSESNRLLILQKINPKISIENLSSSEDTQLLIQGLEEDVKSIHVNHAGTAMRFLTAYLSSKVGRNVILMGSKRMHERPIRILVEGLRKLGAEIQYLEKEGFPPLKITGKDLKGGKLKMNAEISSQFITAILLIAPRLSNELTIDLEGNIASRSYIDLSLELLKRVGVDCNFKNRRIKIRPYTQMDEVVMKIESDWSSASYFYSLVALSDDLEIRMKNFSNSSLQGDSVVVSIYERFGVTTSFDHSERTITLKKNTINLPKEFQIDLKETPDIAQTLAVTCFGLGVECTISGLHTLKYKETNRLQALKKELEKIGAKVEITNDLINVIPNEGPIGNTEIDTYEDHRMAMSFAPLAIKAPIVINKPNVVSKSYPTYWEDLQKIGFSIEIK